MAVFPNYHFSDNTEYGRSILQQMEENWGTHSGQNLSFQAQADMDVRFYVGDQQVYSDVYGFNQNFQQNFIVNLIKRLVEMPVGHQMENRRSIITTPVEGSDQLTSDQMTKTLMWNDRQAKLPDIYSDAFKGACMTGLTWVDFYLDWTTDPICGDIMADLSHYSEVIFDPFMSRIDMSDCDFWWRRSYVSENQAHTLLPGYEDLVKNVRPSTVKSTMDGKFQFTPQSIFYNSTKLYTYDEYWHRIFRDQQMIINESNGMFLEWRGTPSGLRDYLSYIKQNFPNDSIIVRENKIPSVARAIVLNGIMVEDEYQPYKLDIYPIVPVMAYWTPQSTSLYNKIQGIVRGARDPQYLFNKFLVNMMDCIDAQPHSGFIAEEDSVRNPKSLHASGPGRVIWKKKGVGPDAIVRIDPPPLPVAQQQTIEMLQKLMIDTTGANETNLGLKDDKVAGVLNMLNQRAGLTTLNSIFDNLDRAMKRGGEIRMQMIQNNFTPHKMERILNEEPSQQFYERVFGKYDVVIEDGYDTSTQRQLAFAQGIKLRELLGEVIPASWLVSKATIQDKNDLVQTLKQQEQQQAQIMQTQAQGAAEEQQATIAMAKAQAAYQVAGAQERNSRIIENVALSKKNEEEATLKKAETLQKLADLDIVQIERLLAISNILDQNINMSQNRNMAAPPATPQTAQSQPRQ